MNRIAQQKQSLSRRIAYAIAAGGFGVLLSFSLAACALETGEGDSTSTTAVGGEKAPPVETAPSTVTRTTTPNSQPGPAARGAAPPSGPGGGEDPQPQPWIGTDNADNADQQGSPLDRQQMGTTVEHK
jgi:hypothetical protein